MKANVLFLSGNQKTGVLEIEIAAEEGRYFDLTQYNGKTTRFTISNFTTEEAQEIIRGMVQFINDVNKAKKEIQ